MKLVASVLSLYVLCLTLMCTSKEKTKSEVPDWVVFPKKKWQTITLEEAGMSDVEAWNHWVDSVKQNAKGASFQAEDHSGNQWGVVITRGGYVIQTFGNPEYKYQTASLGKCFTMACLQLAIDEGIIKSGDDLIKDYWTGEGQLNSSHKYLNKGYHNTLSFNHLKNHTGGFPITNGWSWQNCNNYGDEAPSWAKCTQDPDYDNYAHAEPGSVGKHYSSGGYWRLVQALTAVWQKDLKQVMDEKLFSHMGISAGSWIWPAGETVHDSTTWYPSMPGYGLFLDPPYYIDGHIIRGGQWVVMSAEDLARYGLLVATGGIWDGKRLISYVRGHNGGNGSNVGGKGGDIMGSWGKVTTNFKHGEIPWQLFTSEVRIQETN
ncbi:serine hydrolase domain-containing protein [Bacteroidota bacterium]